MDAAEGYSGRLRKRKRALGDGNEEALQTLLQLVEGCGKVVIFSGSGLSANSGMSMFTTKNGLYERARSKFKIQDGMKLFSFPFYKQRRKDLQAFFAQIYSEAQSSRAAPGHVAIAELHKMGRLQRHYTLNIDGLAAAVGMDTWHHEHNPDGSTVEMHGNISYVVCPSCHAVEPLTGVVMETMKASEAVLCKACNEDEMRFKVMLYDDEQGDCITPEDVFERLDDDLAVAGAVIWVGISFEQSASTEYFRKVRHMLSSHGRLHQVTQVIVNPSEEPYFNVVSTMSNREDVKVLDVRATSDDALPRVVQHLHQLGGTSPDSAALKAAAAAAAAAEEARHKRNLEQQQQQAAAQQAAAEQCTPKAPQGRRMRRSSSMAGAASPADPPTALPVCQGQPVGSASYAELASMDSAAAAALSLPAAVQQHFLQKQLQQRLSSPGGAGDGRGGGGQAGPIKAQQQPVPQAAAAVPPPAPQPPPQPPPPPASALAAAAAGAASVLGNSQQNGLPHAAAAPLSNLQQLLGQLQAAQALQTALASTQQQAVAAAAPAAPPVAAGSLQQLALPLLVAALSQAPAAHQLGGAVQPPGIGPLLAAALAGHQPARLPSAQPAAAATTAAATGGPLAAVLQLLSQPASNGSNLSNGAAAADTAAPAVAAPSSAAAGAGAAASQQPPVPSCKQEGVAGDAADVSPAADAGGGAAAGGEAHPATNGLHDAAAAADEAAVKDEGMCVDD